MTHIPERWKVYVDTKTWNRNTKIFVTADGHDGRRILITRAIMREIDYGQSADELCFIDADTPEATGLLQAFIDAAWAAGLRPEGYEEPQNELKATKAHLNDMRRIVAKKIGVDL